MSNTALLLDSVFERHDPGPGHPESVARYKEISKVLKGSDYFKKCKKIKIRKATDSEILGCHTDKYLEIVKTEIGEGKSELSTGDTSICRDSLEVASYATGSVLEAIDLVLKGDSKNGFCAIRPPGHHATADRGMGFCIFNNVAVAAKYAQIKFGLDRVAIIDWDVHHGNGTQQAFYDDPNVLTISIHQDGLFPSDSGRVSERGEKEGENFHINIPLPSGSGHGAYVTAIERIIIPAVRSFEPQLILVPSGFDASVYDPLGRMLLTSESFRELTNILVGLANDVCSGKIIFSHEGGYSKRYVPFCGIATIEALSGIDTGIIDLGGRDDLPGQELMHHQEILIDEIAKSVVTSFR